MATYWQSKRQAIGYGQKRDLNENFAVFQLPWPNKKNQVKLKNFNAKPLNDTCEKPWLYFWLTQLLDNQIV